MLAVFQYVPWYVNLVLWTDLLCFIIPGRDVTKWLSLLLLHFVYRWNNSCTMYATECAPVPAPMRAIKPNALDRNLATQ